MTTYADGGSRSVSFITAALSGYSKRWATNRFATPGVVSVHPYKDHIKME